MNWPTVRLSDVAPAVPADKRFESDTNVWLLSLDQIESHTGEIASKKYAPASMAGTSTFAFDVGNVLYSKLRPYLNKVSLPDEPGIATTELVPLRPNPKVLDRRYLAYYLRAPLFVARASARVAGAKMPRVQMDWLRAYELPLPPLSEQRRVVEILEQTNNLRICARVADAKAARILPALFLKMFGDPSTNPMDWPVKSIKDVANVVGGATPRTEQEEYFGGDILWATPKDLSNLDDYLISDTSTKLTDEGVASCSTKILPPGSLLLSSRAPIGLVAINAKPMCTNQGFKSLVPRDEITPWYLLGWALLAKDYIQSQGRGATFTEISKAIVENLRIPVPDRKLQDRFSRHMTSVRTVLLQAKKSAAQLDEVWANLLQLAFSGQLTSEWRKAHMQELLAEMQEQARILGLPVAELLEI